MSTETRLPTPPAHPAFSQNYDRPITFPPLPPSSAYSPSRRLAVPSTSFAPSFNGLGGYSLSRPAETIADLRSRGPPKRRLSPPPSPPTQRVKWQRPPPSIRDKVESLDPEELQDLMVTILETHPEAAGLLDAHLAAKEAEKDAEAAERKANPRLEFPGFVRKIYHNVYDESPYRTAISIKENIEKAIAEVSAHCDDSDRWETRLAGFLALGGVAKTVAHEGDDDLWKEIIGNLDDLETAMLEIAEQMKGRDELGEENREKMLDLAEGLQMTTGSGKFYKRGYEPSFDELVAYLEEER